jgi:RNA polymerase sigma-70 factor (sigma-E family)
MIGAVPLGEVVEIDTAVDGVGMLFQEHYQTLLRAVYLMLGSQGDAEEVVQEAFARLLASRSRLRDPVRAPGYLRVTAFNLARDRLRKVHTGRRFAPRLRPIDIDEPAAETVALRGEDRRSVVKALSRLPLRQRECLVLRYYLDLSEAEIAEAMGVARGSVKSHASRGLAALSALLEERQ